MKKIERVWKKKNCIICENIFQPIGPHQNYCSLQCRFVDFPIQKNQETGCWIWTGSLSPKGYGQSRFFGNRRNAHQLSWECFHGYIPKSLCVCHSCHNPSCVNPDHLYLATSYKNQYDSKILSHSPLAKKLTQKDVIVIKRLLDQNLSQRKIAKLFPVTHSLIGKIKRKEIWTHI